MKVEWDIGQLFAVQKLDLIDNVLDVLVSDMLLYCVDVGADVLDQTGQNTEMFGHLQEEEVSFELSPKQINYFKTMHHINSYLREEYHTLHEFLWRTGFSAKSSSWPKWSVGSELQ